MKENQSTTASKRAAMPKGTNAVLDRRTLSNSNNNLLDIVMPGDIVLDVGCGSGSITAGIADLVGTTGMVFGIDSSKHLIELARQKFDGKKNLTFYVADINNYQPELKFDVITSARVLQWVNNPVELVLRMAELLKEDGILTILDYNHEKIKWEPAPPHSMKLFYNAFLRWRADAGMDNQIADHLEVIFTNQGLKQLRVTSSLEIVSREDGDFLGSIDIWAKVAETRGLQLVQDGYITDEQRLTAITDYRSWAAKEAQSMTLYLMAVSGHK